MVATLILILIAVAAAAALYLWLVGWQGSVTGSISKPGVNQGSFTMGGSTSVYPFSSLAVSWYEQNNTGVTISDTQGGTGAGMLAVCSGNIDVGAASTPETSSGLIASDGCPASDASTITITTVAYDSVDLIMSSAGVSDHGLLSLSFDTLNYIYEAGSTTAPNAFIPTMDGSNIPVEGGAPALSSASYVGGKAPGVAWDQIPATVLGVSFASGALYTTGSTPSTAAITQAADSAVYAPPTAKTPSTPEVCGVAAAGPYNMLCDSQAFSGAGVAGTPCGFLICAGGTSSGTTEATANIAPVERSDASGTTQTFEAKLLGYGAVSGSLATSSTTWVNLPNPYATGSFANLGYNGCGTNNLLTDCGISVAAQENGNPGVLSYVAGNPNALGYASDGLARTYAGIGTGGIIPFDGVGQVGALPQTSGTNYAYGAVVPSTGSTGSIAGGVTASTSINNYAGWRPFELVTLAPPTGVVESFFTYVLQVGINTGLSTAEGEVSIYSI